MKHSDDLVLIPVSNNTYLGYHSLYGNIKSFDKFMLAIILEPDRFINNESKTIQKYLELFTKEHYVIEENMESSNAKPGLKSLVGEDETKKSLVLDLQGSSCRSVDLDQFYKNLIQLLAKFEGENVKYVFLSIVNTGDEINWDCIAKICEIIKKYDNIFFKSVLKLCLEQVELENIEELLSKQFSVIELEINDELLGNQIGSNFSELLKQYETQLIFSYTGSSFTHLANEEFFNFLSKYEIPLKFNLQVNQVASRKNEDLIEELVSFYWRCKNLNIDLYGWWTKPFEAIISSKPGWFCPAYNCQVVLTVDNKLKYCKNIDTDEQMATVNCYLENNKTEFERQQQYCRGCEIEGFCGYGCLQWQGEETQTLCDFLKKLTTQMLVTHWESQ